MATTFSGSLSVEFDMTLTDAGTLSSVVERIRTGAGGMPDIERSLTTGTGANQGNKLWYQERSILTTANDDLDLTALTDRKGIALNFSKIKWAILAIVAPATTKKLIFKGSNATNPVALWKGSALDDEDVFDLAVHVNNVDGWTVTNAASDVLRLHNPGLTTVVYQLFLSGVGT